MEKIKKPYKLERLNQRSQLWFIIKKPVIESLNQHFGKKNKIKQTSWEKNRERLLLMSQSGYIIKINVEKKIKSYGKDK